VKLKIPKFDIGNMRNYANIEEKTYGMSGECEER
jgi:hypothetical protein